MIADYVKLPFGVFGMIEEINKRHNRFILIGSVIYLVGVSGLMLRHNIWFSPDQFFIFALVAAVILGRGRRFIADWAPIILIFLSYEYFRGALPAILKFPLHSTDLIWAEQFVFGVIPTIYLQGLFLDLNHFQWYDFFFSLIYMSFWVVPLVFSYYIWIKNRPLFKFMTLTLFIGCYATFITFTLFPAMPPWMASERELLPHVERILYKTTAYLTVPGALPTLYSLLRGNTVAAMPSMHVELPTMMFLFSLAFKNRGLILLTGLYLLATYFAITYLGEHYVIDGFAGSLYAIAAYISAKWVGKKLRLIDLGPRDETAPPDVKTQ